MPRSGAGNYGPTIAKKNNDVVSDRALDGLAVFTRGKQNDTGTVGSGYYAKAQNNTLASAI